MGGEGYKNFKASSHYKVGCVACHNGIDGTDDKTLAHSGNFVSHPSVLNEEKCRNCHETIVDNFQTSLHNGFGQKRKVAMRSGYESFEDFDKLPAHQIDAYNKNCASCHASCGSCHIVRPSAGGGGLSSGHAFNKQPDMINICVTCHTSRGGHAYLGVASGTQPDVHLTKMGYECMDCHTAGELHGDGTRVEQRYAYSKLPVCNDCHTDVESSNTYHTMHYNDFNCQVCHSQDYNSCGSCHVHGEGARVPSYLDFKIALNPIKDIKQNYDFTLVRRTLAAPDNWGEYGIEYSNFDVLPTYNYTTPHNILRWTDRTQVSEGAHCSSSCHIQNTGSELLNKELYLFEEFLLDWEKNATSPIAVDGHLPPTWLSK
jgi:hypothetical protein